MEEKQENGLQALMMKASHLCSRALCEDLKEQGMSPGQVCIMRLLEQKEGLSQCEIGKYAGIRPSSVSVAMQKLEREGILERKMDPEDTRKSRVYLTEKGRLELERFSCHFVESDERCFQGFDEEEKRKMEEFLRRVIRNLEE
ncbi:MAG: MarR family transcriptional regulator [Eubacteriales bacterium]|nr:MarR family transcriptional regulator [Eubacteriales bacterium]